MTKIRSILRQLGLTVVCAMVLASASSASHAFTADQQRLCTSDAFRLCGFEIPNLDRITSCMREHKSDLSQACKAVFEK